jgi:N-acetylglucosaminyldiphosphoundecaprenol N-acetyl-beta-D-mannosaminyltransferase
MIDLGKQNIIGVGVSAIDYDAATKRIIHAAKQKRPFAVSALAVHGVMSGVLDGVHRHRLNSLDLVVPDGQPVRWAMKWLHGVVLQDRVYGPELTLRICEKAAEAGMSIYLYGSRDEVLDRLRSNLTKNFPKLNIAGSQPSRFRQVSLEEQQRIAREIQESGASIVFVGLGCPRQETWVFENRDLLSMPLIAVGAAFDFHAGLLSQAPSWLQSRGLEWLYRLFREPRRLWKRYATTNTLYILFLFAQWARPRAFDLDDTISPTVQMRFG